MELARLLAGDLRIARQKRRRDLVLKVRYVSTARAPRTVPRVVAVIALPAKWDPIAPAILPAQAACAVATFAASRTARTASLTATKPPWIAVAHVEAVGVLAAPAAAGAPAASA